MIDLEIDSMWRSWVLALILATGCRFDSSGLAVPSQHKDRSPGDAPRSDLGRLDLPDLPRLAELRPFDRTKDLPPVDKPHLDKPPADKPPPDKPPAKLDKGPPPSCASTYGTKFNACKDNGLSCDVHGFGLAMTCSQLCATNGWGTCQGVYVEGRGPCARSGSKLPCNTPLVDHICVCDKIW